MGKTRDLLKKIRDTKGTFHAMMGTIKDRNGMDLAETEDIKKMWQEYTEEVYKKDLHDPDNHDGVITHLEPDILECEVKWALGSITMNKASGGDGIPVKLFQILKDKAVKVLHSRCKFGKLISGHKTGKGQFSFQSQRKAMPKNVQTTQRLLLNDKTLGFLASGGHKLNLGPEVRLDRSELLCNQVSLKYKGDREGF